MNVKAIKSEIIDILDKIEDEKVIEAYRDILLSLHRLRNSNIAGYSASGEALSEDLLKKEIIEAQTRIKSGQYIAHKEIKNRG